MRPKQTDFRTQPLFLGICYSLGFNERFYEEVKERDKKRVPFNEHLLGTSASAWYSLTSPWGCETTGNGETTRILYREDLKLREVKSLVPRSHS